jgi:hypothetical protein
MRSNFDSPLKVVNGVVKASGDLGWDTGDTDAFVSVTIIQMDQKLVGTASSRRKFPPWMPGWVVDVKPTHRKFKPGRAQALGVAVTVNAGNLRLFSWKQNVRLER